MTLLMIALYFLMSRDGRPSRQDLQNFQIEATDRLPLSPYFILVFNPENSLVFHTTVV